jgi:hypothetical protein
MSFVRICVFTAFCARVGASFRYRSEMSGMVSFIDYEAVRGQNFRVYGELRGTVATDFDIRIAGTLCVAQPPATADGLFPSANGQIYAWYTVTCTPNTEVHAP